jgi:hypothetical protein
MMACYSPFWLRKLGCSYSFVELEVSNSVLSIHAKPGMARKRGHI